MASDRWVCSRAQSPLQWGRPIIPDNDWRPYTLTIPIISSDAGQGSP